MKRKRLPLEKQFCSNCERAKGQMCGLHGCLTIAWCMDWS